MRRPNTVRVPRDRRHGIALVLVLVTLSVVGALTAGLFLLAWRDLASGTRAVQRTRAFAAAEHGLLATLARWDPRWTAAPPGLVALRQLALDDGASDTVRVWMLAPSSAMLVSQGVAARPPDAAQRRLNLVVLLRPARAVVRAALTVHGTVVVRGGASVDGTDADRDGGPDCPPDTASRAAIAVPNATLVDTAGCGAPCLTGAPPVLAAPLDSAVDPAAALGLDGSALATVAQPIFGGTIAARPTLDAGGACDLDDPLNFGDPAPLEPPCRRWAPPRAATGDLRLDGGVGQGLLIVDGDLTVTHGAWFAGIVLVRGTLRVDGASRLEGAIAAERAVLDGASVLRFASCAVARAGQGAAQPSRAPGPAWVEQN